MCLGSLDWGGSNTSIYSDGPHSCDALEELGVSQMVCSDRSLLVLSLSGKVYQMLYASKTEVSVTKMIFDDFCDNLSLTLFTVPKTCRGFI